LEPARDHRVSPPPGTPGVGGARVRLCLLHVETLMNLIRSVAIAASLILPAAAPLMAQDYGNLIDVATGLNTPVCIAAAPGDDTKLYVVEQGGTIRIINVTTDGLGNKSYALSATPFFDMAALDAANPYFRDGSNVPLQDQSGTVIPRMVRNGGANIVNNGHSYAVQRYNEQGLLSVAFAPDFVTSGKFYIWYSMNAPAANGNITWSFSGNGTTSAYVANTSGQDALFEFQRDPNNPNTVLASSEKQVLTVADPYVNHNGGQLIFGRDGYLYLSIGDGGSGNDPGDRSGNPSVLLGKMLRINPAVDDYPADNTKNYGIPADNPFVAGGGAPEVWARGLRNPWRWSFDRWNGDMWIGDVGQDLWEEVDHVAGNGGPNRHYGWRAREGLISTGIATAYSATYTSPLYVYPHSTSQAGTNGNYASGTSGAAVVGGYVYRGNAIRPWRGKYIFADTYGNHVWAFNSTVTPGAGTPAAVGLEDWNTILRSTVGGVTPTSIQNIVSFGEDNDGEVFIVQITGKVRKIVPQNTQPALADVGSQGGIAGADGAFDNNDFVVFIDWFFNGDPRADMGKQGGLRGVDQLLDNNDFIVFIDAFFLHQ
jgi:glucose/arabinose dehydrogenase